MTGAIEMDDVNERLTEGLRSLLQKGIYSDAYRPDGSNASMVITSDNDILKANEAVWNAILSLTQRPGPFAMDFDKQIPICKTMQDVPSTLSSKEDYTEYFGKLINNYFACLYHSRIKGVRDPNQKNRIAALVHEIVSLDKSSLVKYEPDSF